MHVDHWLLLTDYSSKYRISVSTLRRRIKSGHIQYRFESGKYFIFDAPMRAAENPTLNTDSLTFPGIRTAAVDAVPLAPAGEEMPRTIRDQVQHREHSKLSELSIAHEPTPSATFIRFQPQLVPPPSPVQEHNPTNDDQENLRTPEFSSNNQKGNRMGYETEFHSDYQSGHQTEDHLSAWQNRFDDQQNHQPIEQANDQHPGQDLRLEQVPDYARNEGPENRQETHLDDELINEPIISSATRLLNELKRAYMNILQEKEGQIITLKEEVSDLKTLVRALEDDNERMRRMLAQQQ